MGLKKIHAPLRLFLMVGFLTHVISTASGEYSYYSKTMRINNIEYINWWGQGKRPFAGSNPNPSLLAAQTRAPRACSSSIMKMSIYCPFKEK